MQQEVSPHVDGVHSRKMTRHQEKERERERESSERERQISSSGVILPLKYFMILSSEFQSNHPQNFSSAISRKPAVCMYLEKKKMVPAASPAQSSWPGDQYKSHSERQDSVGKSLGEEKFQEVFQLDSINAGRWCRG